MISRLRLANFKSWRDTGDIELGKLTGLFGTNSSGKTSLLQALLMLKQTAESTDRKQVVKTGDAKSIVDLGTLSDVLFAHGESSALEIELAWPDDIEVKDPESESILFRAGNIAMKTRITLADGRPMVEEFRYITGDKQFGMKRVAAGKRALAEYELISEGFSAVKIQGRPWPLHAPVKCYGFPDEVNGKYQNVKFLADFVLALEKLMSGTVYLGPLREYPSRQYTWGGEAPEDVGSRGASAVAALLASKRRGDKVRVSPKKSVTVEERVARWLKEMDLIHSFEVKQIVQHRKDYEVRVRRTPSSSEVFITDVGFGVSQILPVLVLCYYVPEGTTILLEQPEIHLHPSVQSALADVLIDAVKRRRVQVIVESHSEHLLRRFQRRIAESTIPRDDVKMFFCKMQGAESKIEPLDLDLLGNIDNWPDKFFGDEIGDLAAMTTAQMQRTSHATK